MTTPILKKIENYGDIGHVESAGISQTRNNCGENYLISLIKKYLKEIQTIYEKNNTGRV